jgi:hypothetical protein
MPRPRCWPSSLEMGDSNNELDDLTSDEYRQLYQAAQCLSKLALEQCRSYTGFPDEFPYDDLSGGISNRD